ncbi:MAG: hypothetical protein H7177_14695 [Rhizobacter sp.]|nr:hypothetical protein [Bacteriovorax sp.]
MKALSILALTLLSAQAYAGSWSYSCESTDGKVKLTRDNLVIVEKEKSGSISALIIKPANDTVNTGPEIGESLVYKDSYEGKTEGDVTVSFTKILSDKQVDGEETDCPKGDSGSHGPGFSTNKKVFKGTVSQYDKSTPVTLNCYETFGWSGRCQFDGEEK